MVHVTYAAHGLHRVSKKVQIQFGTVNTIIVYVEKILKKASSVHIFKSYALNITLPPEPIITS